MPSMWTASRSADGGRYGIIRKGSVVWWRIPSDRAISTGGNSEHWKRLSRTACRRFAPALRKAFLMERALSLQPRPRPCVRTGAMQRFQDTAARGSAGRCRSGLHRGDGLLQSFGACPTIGYAASQTEFRGRNTMKDITCEALEFRQADLVLAPKPRCRRCGRQAGLPTADGMRSSEKVRSSGGAYPRIARSLQGRHLGSEAGIASPVPRVPALRTCITQGVDHGTSSLPPAEASPLRTNQRPAEIPRTARGSAGRCRSGFPCTRGDGLLQSFGACPTIGYAASQTECPREEYHERYQVAGVLPCDGFCRARRGNPGRNDRLYLFPVYHGGMRQCPESFRFFG